MLPEYECAKAAALIYIPTLDMWNHDPRFLQMREHP